MREDRSRKGKGVEEGEGKIDITFKDTCRARGPCTQTLWKSFCSRASTTLRAQLDLKNRINIL